VVGCGAARMGIDQSCRQRTVEAAKTAFTDNLPKTLIAGGTSAGVGFVMSRVLESGLAGTVLKRAGVVGLGLSLALDILPKARETANAFYEGGKSDAGLAANIGTVRKNVGSFAFDAAWMTATGFAGGMTGRTLGSGRLFESSLSREKLVGPALEFDHQGFLKPGTHPMKWNDFAATYGVNEHRSTKLTGMLDGLHDLRKLGVNEVYVGGSFVTKNPMPNDFDAAFNVARGTWEEKYLSKLPALFSKHAMKDIYGGEFMPNGPRNGILNALSFNSREGVNRAVGVVQLNLNGLPPRPNFADAAQREVAKRAVKVVTFPGGTWTHEM
jgi:hypothetical protein